jgi:GNAT superfamily N-acetyltransferase
MAPGYTIRLSRRAELDLLTEIEREATGLFQSYPEDLGLNFDDIQLVPADMLLTAHQDGRLRVAADSADKPVGFALITELGLFAHLHELDVRPAHGRRGIGAALVEAVCEWARPRGFSAVTLSTFRDVPWNAPFYARHGFEVIPADELSKELCSIVERERSQGLRTDKRVVMQREL